jgi:large subunit ribosomal protein L23
MTMDPYSIILYPFVTEKSMGHMEKDNALEFMVKRTANKALIKKAVEKMFSVKVKSVNTRITPKGKHATVVFMPEYKAEDLGMRIGVF